MITVCSIRSAASQSHSATQSRRTSRRARPRAVLPAHPHRPWQVRCLGTLPKRSSPRCARLPRGGRSAARRVKISTSLCRADQCSCPYCIPSWFLASQGTRRPQRKQRPEYLFPQSSQTRAADPSRIGSPHPTQEAEVLKSQPVQRRRAIPSGASVPQQTHWPGRFSLQSLQTVAVATMSPPAAEALSPYRKAARISAAIVRRPRSITWLIARDRFRASVYEAKQD